MYLTEVIAQKRLYDKKITELKSLLEVRQTEELAKELMGLLELRQAKCINISQANEQATVHLGGTDISITVAVMIRETIKAKLDVLTSLINNPDTALDKISLQKQRDRHFNEYTLISMAVQRNDLNVTVG